MNDFFAHCLAHVVLALSALGAGGTFGIGIGLIAYEYPVAARPLIGIAAILRVVPSLAVLMIVLPWLGIGPRPAIFALSLLAVAPVALGVESALRGVPRNLLECGRAMGLTPLQLRLRVAWPLALPAGFTGIRTAAVEAIAGATLAAFVGGGGLGEYIVEGLATSDTTRLLEGGLSVAVLACAAELLLGAAQRRTEYHG